MRCWELSDTVTIWKGACTSGSALGEAYEAQIGSPFTNPYDAESLKKHRERRRKANREKMAKRREKLRARVENDNHFKKACIARTWPLETPEQTEDRKAKTRATTYKHRANLTPEQVEMRKEKDKQTQRTRWAAKAAAALAKSVQDDDEE